MVERVANILRHEWREIIGSPLIIELLDIYSKLYLNGGQPNACERCHREYFAKLIKNGKIMAEKYQEVLNRTCIPAWKGVKYIPKQARHFDSENMTDAEAIRFLKQGQLDEDDFIKLPKVLNENKEDLIELAVKKTDQIQKPINNIAPKKRGPKKQVK